MYNVSMYTAHTAELGDAMKSSHSANIFFDVNNHPTHRFQQIFTNSQNALIYTYFGRGLL